jgi:UDP-N-acetylmuramyl pentapeptide phosphotransferase/UDP-N-acetylglucosamine-1-phosphate transferase
MVSSETRIRAANIFLVSTLLAPPLGLLLAIPDDAFGSELSAKRYVLLQLGLSICGFLGVVYMVEVMKGFCLRKKQIGKDLCKKGTPAGELEIPESAGLSPGIIYLVIIILCQLLYARTEQSQADYASSLLSICFMLFLGFVDDVLVRIVASPMTISLEA